MLIQISSMLLAVAGLVNIFLDNTLPGFACICFAGILSILYQLIDISKKLDMVGDSLKGLCVTEEITDEISIDIEQEGRDDIC